ncbi:Aldehyde/histidinol dehydrogenase [Chytriomyces sp. MP71]|nr:Aldehyde/histidinol dehydrogenase [Chytriomyces sp. MP71]
MRMHQCICVLVSRRGSTRFSASVRKLFERMAPATPLPEIDGIVSQLRRTFDTNKTKSLAWRRDQLTRIYHFARDNAAVKEALRRDLNKSDGEIAGELLVLTNDAADAIEHLEEWTAPYNCKQTLATLGDRVQVRREPLGVVCIIAPWNFPVQLLLGPLVAAIAAGCCVVLKPSEVASATEAMVLEWIPKILDTSAIRVVVGGVAETTRLLDTKFDHFFYTGSGNVGKIVMAAAARQLTPVVLELGGKSPVYIHHDVNIEIAARRLMWAKTTNCGQVCIAPDYVMVHKRIARPFLEAMKRAVADFFGSNVRTSSDYSRIINKAHTQRLLNVLNRQLALPHCKLELGGESDLSERFIAPTIVSGVRVTDPLMEDEIFGPLLGVFEVDNEDEAIRVIKSRDRPLALYINANDSRVTNKMLDNTISGVAVVNDYMLNMIVGDMPFGGVGASGMGAYHGHSGFLSFTHQRGLVWRKTDSLTEASHKLLYPPHVSNPRSLQIARAASGKGLPTAWGRVVKRYLPALWKYFVYWLVFWVGGVVGRDGVQGALGKVLTLLGK